MGIRAWFDAHVLLYTIPAIVYRFQLTTMFFRCCAAQGKPLSKKKDELTFTGAFDDDTMQAVQDLIQVDIDAWGREATEHLAKFSHEKWSEILRLRSRAKAVENFRMWRRGGTERWRREVLWKGPITKKVETIHKDLMAGPTAENWYLNIDELKILGSLETEEWQAVVELEHRWHDWMEFPTDNYGKPTN